MRKPKQTPPKQAPVAEKPAPPNGNPGNLVPPEQAASINYQAGYQAAAKELLASSAWNPYLALIRSLPTWSDDIERDFGAKVYDDMLNDPDCSGAIETLVNRTFDQGVKIVPSVVADALSDDRTTAEAKNAKEVADFVEWAISDMEIPFEDVLLSVLTDGLSHGHKLSEIVMDDGMYEGKPALRCRCLDPKPREVFRFICDRNFRVLAILGIIPGVGIAITEGMIGDPRSLPNTVAPEKFVILTFPGRNRDPRGRSKLRPAYNAWWLKLQTWGQLLQWLVQLAGGFIWAEVAPNAKVDATKPGTIEEQTAAKAAQIRNGSVVAFANGGKLYVERPEGNGDQFWESIKGFGRQIFTAILTQETSHKESVHSSKASSSVGTDLTDAVVNRVRGVLSRTIRKQFFRTIVRMQYSEEWAQKYTPLLSLEGAPDSDFAANATALGTLAVELTPEQTQEAVSKRLGLTPDVEGYKTMKEQSAQQAAAMKPGQPENDPANPGDPKPKKSMFGRGQRFKAASGG